MYLPTHRVTPDSGRDPIRLRNLLDEAESRLLAEGLRAPAVREVLRPGRELSRPGPFWSHQSGGLALFLAPRWSRAFRLPAEFPELAVVTGRFHVKPLLALLAAGHRFYLLALSQNEVRLFEGTPHGVQEAGLADVPRSLREAVEYDDLEKELGPVVSSRAGGFRPEAAGRSLTSQRSLGDADALAAGSAWSALRRRAGQFDCVPCGGGVERGGVEPARRCQPAGPALVELTEFDRPRRLGSRTASSMMETSGALTFTAEDQGTVMSWAWQVHPKGLAADTRPALRPPRRPHGAQDLGRAEAPARRQHKPSPRLTDSAVPGALRYRLATAPSQGSKRPAEPPGLTGEHLGGASAAARAPAP